MLEAIGNALRIPELRRKILFTLGLFVVFRILAHIAVPGADKAALDKLFNSNAFLGLLDLFSGGGLSTFSIIAMGVNPYINASIIMQLMTVVSTRMKELSKEGEFGRRKITRWTRWLTVALGRSEEHTSELQSRRDLVCRLLLEKKNAAEKSCETHRTPPP